MATSRQLLLPDNEAPPPVPTYEDPPPPPIPSRPTPGRAAAPPPAAPTSRIPPAPPMAGGSKGDYDYAFDSDSSEDNYEYPKEHLSVKMATRKQLHLPDNVIPPRRAPPHNLNLWEDGHNYQLDSYSSEDFFEPNYEENLEKGGQLKGLGFEEKENIRRILDEVEQLQRKQQEELMRQVEEMERQEQEMEKQRQLEMQEKGGQLKGLRFEEKEDTRRILDEVERQKKQYETHFKTFSLMPKPKPRMATKPELFLPDNVAPVKLAPPEKGGQLEGLRFEEKEDTRRILDEVERQRKQQEELMRQAEEMERQEQEMEKQRQLEMQRLEEIISLVQEEEERKRREMEEQERRRKEEKMRREEEMRQKKEMRKLRKKQEEMSIEAALRHYQLRQIIERQKQQEELEEWQKQHELQRRQEKARQQQELMQRKQQEALKNIQHMQSHLEGLRPQFKEHAPKPEMSELKDLGIVTSADLKEVMKFGTYSCFWNRIFLVGQFAVGKSSLAKVLIGEDLPEIPQSTDGIWIYRGRAGMKIDNRQWIYLPKGNANVDIVAGMLLSLKNRIEKDSQPRNSDTEDEYVDISEDPNAKTKDDISDETFIEECPDTLLQEPKVDTKVDPTETSIEKPLDVREFLEENMAKNFIMEKVNTLIADAIRKGQYQQRIVPFDVWDFGGQKEFYMTHQLFMTSRGVFVLLFNGSKDLTEDVASMHEPFHKNTSEAVYLLCWVNCILTFCTNMKNGFPRIIVVATHKDKVLLKKRNSQKLKLQNALENMFRSHSGFNHLEIKPLIFINANDPEDPEIEVLRKRLIDRAFEHPRWGEEMPTAWVPLELMLAEKVEEGINIISYDEIKKLNQKSEVLVMSETQLEAFLRVQHSLGKILYFDDFNLRDYIIINPVFLVDLLRSLVTDQQFWPKDEISNSICRKLLSTGTILRKEITVLWNQEPFRPFLKYADYLLHILVHLDILVPLLPDTSNLLTSKQNQDQESVYIVPCMVQKSDDSNYLRTKCTNSTSIVLSYDFKGEVIPPALGFRFLAYLISMYKIKSFKGQYMLFSDLVVVEVDENHDVCVQIKGKQVIVHLVHKENVSKIEPTLASSIQECLTASIYRVSDFYSGLSKEKDNQSNEDKQESSTLFEINFGVLCVNTICFFPHCQLQLDGDKTWRCKHDTVHSVRELAMWFAEKVPAKHCPEDCQGLGRLESEQCPLDVHLRRLAASISPEECKKVVICLGSSFNMWTNLEFQFQHQNPDDLKFKALHRWKQENLSASFALLAKALNDCDLSDHYLCTIFRDIELPKEYNNDGHPTTYLLDKVSKHIGNMLLQFALELGLDAAEIEEIQHRYKGKLLKQTQKILCQWEAENGRASNKNLIKALFRIGKASCLKGINL